MLTVKELVWKTDEVVPGNDFITPADADPLAVALTEEVQVLSVSGFDGQATGGITNRR